jgi:nitric oxide reductase NorE protein
VATTSTKSRRPARPKHVPGEEGVWIFILGDMTVFALLFGVFIQARSKDPALFDHASAQLNQNYGAVNTLFLLTSSLLVITGIRAIRDHMTRIAPWCFAGAMACGFGFLTLKVLEYHHELSHGLKPATNDFFMYFFVLTGLHAFHLLIGMGVLTFCFISSRKPEPPSEKRFAFIEGGACFWHMVDLLWIVLFPLLYLMK